MCGIVGILSLRGGRPDETALARMGAAMVHRGPDDEGVHLDGGVALGFRRLSIIDLSCGHQPLSTADERYTIIFNGEIYNHAEVREVLERDHGREFRTSSDTEVIVNAYAVWGEAALERLNGMFAFAVWDKRERLLFLARDRTGKKPLYFVRTAGEFVFASEIKVLLEHPGVPREVDRSRIATFLTYRYVPGAETLFRGIELLPAASCMTVTETGEMSPPRRYWDYEFAPPAAPDLIRDEDEAARQLEELLFDSTRLRMIADVPFGAYLSGGIDSSVVVALMSRLHPEPLKTFSVGFDTGFSEAEHARVVARQFNTDHHELTVGSDDLIRTIPAALRARETPVSEPSDIPIYLLSQLARSKVTVVLSGEGSDEIFAGYPKYAMEQMVRTRLPFFPRSVAGLLASRLPYKLRRAQLALECLSHADRFERHACWFGAFGPAGRERLLTPDLRDGADVHAWSRNAVAGKKFSSAVEEMLYLDTLHWLPANLLLRGDRMTMAHSLELRCPFLDYRLVEFAARRLPLKMKVRGMNGKWILKKVAERVLPHEIVHRKKWGFKVPVGEWFRGPLAASLRETLLSPEALARGYYHEPALRRLIEEHTAGRVNHEKQLWILYQLELWHRMYIDR